MDVHTAPERATIAQHERPEAVTIRCKRFRLLSTNITAAVIVAKL
jgi:hypothetical protein